MFIIAAVLASKLAQVSIMPQAKKKSNAVALIKQCRDAGFEPSWRPDCGKVNTRSYLTVVEMQNALSSVGRLLRKA